MNMDVQAIDQTQASGQAANANQPGLHPFPSPRDPSQSVPPQRGDETLQHALKQLIGGGSDVSVQFRVVGPNEVVTVFKNSETGEVISQFPAESMVLIAQFFSKLAGAVVDRTA
ncbi:MAG: hypothetical protein NVS4B13_04090 [Candidatus Elarobacter sp.]